MSEERAAYGTDKAAEQDWYPAGSMFRITIPVTLYGMERRLGFEYVLVVTRVCPERTRTSGMLVDTQWFGVFTSNPLSLSRKGLELGVSHPVLSHFLFGLDWEYVGHAGVEAFLPIEFSDTSDEVLTQVRHRSADFDMLPASRAWLESVSSS